ncbi:hypothetical protein GQ53DRAFT_741446 [Thozetella sp. PMI_491]|nr:hypothetical protein GQ53DRAFT_741446 [Thozetella sp. PMI_491]
MAHTAFGTLPGSWRRRRAHARPLQPSDSGCGGPHDRKQRQAWPGRAGRQQVRRPRPRNEA